LTSLHPEAHGVRGTKDVLPDPLLTLPEALKSHGYETFALHGNPWLEERFGFEQGFDGFLFKHWYEDTLDARVVNEGAIEWLDERRRHPFFLYLHYMDVHSPWRPPAEFDRFSPAPRSKYDGSILYLYAQLNELHAQLKKRGLLDNTWIVITADHGEEFGELGNYKRGHGVTLYQEVLRVPLTFHRSNAASGKRVSRQVRLVDVAPTILDLAGAPVPRDMDGVSPRGDILGAPSKEDLEAVSQVGLNDMPPEKDLLAVTTPTFKYIVDFIAGAEELYDLRADPGETRNLVAANPAAAREFHEKAQQFRRMGAAKRMGRVPEAEIDEELKEQLRSLGYLK
jgi:arylsulfatase A-like enzyme